jgi:hypothetical protein
LILYLKNYLATKSHEETRRNKEKKMKKEENSKFQIPNHKGGGTPCRIIIPNSNDRNSNDQNNAPVPPAARGPI